MTYRPAHFRLEELVPRAIFEARGEAAWELLDARALRSRRLDAKTVRKVRELLADEPEIAALEAEADELRKDVILTGSEKKLALEIKSKTS